MLYNTRNPHGGDVYTQPIRLDYSANTNPFGTPEGVLQAIRECLPHVHQYPDPYCRKLIKAISVYEQVPEQTVFCGNGAADLIYCFTRTVRPKTAVVLAPTFAEYRLGLEQTGCRVYGYRLKQENDFRPDRGILNFLQEIRPQVVFICNPNNPTGKTADFTLLEEILQFCHANGTRLFADECFMDLTENGKSLKEFLPDFPELFILKAFTKSYGMAGVRLGYCLSGDRELLTAMSGNSQPWNVSSLAQAAGTAALQEREFLQKTIRLIGEERKYLTEELRKLGFRVCGSETNFLLFKGPEGLDVRLRKQGIAIRNCDNYEGLGPGWYRIAVRLHSQNEELIRAFGAERNKPWQKT